MNLDLKKYSTFNIGGTAHAVFEIHTISDIEKVDAYCKKNNKPLVIIGEGSNSIFADTTDKYVIGLMKIKGIEIISQQDSFVYIKANAGESWDNLVAWSVNQNLSGLEALSGIPGTVGAAPIQNIGAYGSDVSKVFIEAEVFDTKEHTLKVFSKDMCQFGYRDSIFKKEKGKYMICNITIKLSTSPAPIPQYDDVQNYFISNPKPTIQHIRDAILNIRNSKIPNYKETPNCGSFFKNPVITKEHLEKIQRRFPNIPSFKISDTMYKIFAGWLIEHINYKDIETNSIIFNETNKLVLLNTHNGTFDELQNVLESIIKRIYDTFEIHLEIEPNIFY